MRVLLCIVVVTPSIEIDRAAPQDDQGDNTSWVPSSTYHGVRGIQ